MEEKTTATRRIYDGRVIHLDVLDVELPNGMTSMREIVRHPGAVAIVPLDTEHNVLMVRQFRMAAGKIMLEIPAGTLKPGEDPALCADRELQEEIGHSAGKMDALGAFYVAPGYTTERIFLYLATDLIEARLPMDEDEFIEVERVPLAEAVRLVTSGAIDDGKTINGILRAARIYGL